MGITAALVAILAAAALPQADSTRIYGVVTTEDGSSYTGYIRWDRNEASWADVLHGSKRIPEEHLDQAERLGATERRRDHDNWFVRMAERIFDEDFTGVSTSRESGLRFGHILTLEPRGNSADVVLITGQQVEIRSGGDVGRSVRDITIEDPRRGSVQLEWEDIRRVEFLTPEPGAPSPASSRLYGTLTTRDGQSFTGFVAWDLDEVYASDVLDGEEDGIDREIPFGQIRRIRSAGSDAARVTLRSGRELRLSGSNDVDDDNRDIIISDPAIGDVRVDWDSFRELRFHAPAGPVAVPTLDSYARLHGTVTTRDGRTIRGDIRWDNDEEYDWEFLDGDAGDIQFDIEFARIRSIESRGRHAARVTLLDGRSFTLEDSNDVDDGNNGIFVTPAGGRTVHIGWDDFRRVDFVPSALARP